MKRPVKKDTNVAQDKNAAATKYERNFENLTDHS